MGNQHIAWSSQEVAIIRRLYPVASQQDVVDALPGRSWVAAASYAKRLKLCRTAFANRPWSPEDLATLTASYKDLGPSQLARQLDRSLQSVYIQASKMGLALRTKQHKWSEADEALVRQHYPAGMRVVTLAALIGTKPMNVTSFAHAKGIARTVRAKSSPHCKQRTNGWTEVHLAILHRDYPALGADHVAALVGRPRTAVVAMAQRYRLRRTCQNLTRWSAQDTALVRLHWPAGMPLVELAALVGRSTRTVTNYCVYHKIPRTLRVNRAKQEPVTRPAKVPKEPKSASVKMTELPKAGATKFEGLSKMVKALPVATITRAEAPTAASVAKVKGAVPQKALAKLPNLNAQKALQKKEGPKLVHKSLTVAEFKQLPLDHPGRPHYLRDGARGWDQWLKGQAA